MKKLILLFFAMCLCFPAYTHGNHMTGPSRAEMLLIAERWIAEEGLPNPCVNRLKITMAKDPKVDGVSVRGFASGWRGQVWDNTICEVTIRSGFLPVEECQVLAHEYMHAVYGPYHDGPLDPKKHEAGSNACSSKSTPRQVLHDEIRKMLPKSMIWHIRCSKILCRATSPAARYSRIARYTYLHSGLIIDKIIVEIKNRKSSWRKDK